MATNTYTAIATQTLASAASSVTFNSIPSGYTDLVLVVSINQATGSPQNMLMRFNGDTSSNYSETILDGTGSAAESVRNSNATFMQMDRYGYAPSTGFNVTIANIMNYANTTTYKTVLSRSNNATSGVDAMVHLWRSTSAISSIYLYSGSGGNWAVGSTFSLYGVAATSVGAYATGGTIYSDSTYWYHVFAANGTFTPSTTLSCEVLVVAGGGGGGYLRGGGGGAGGLLSFTSQSLTATGYSVTVGGGGAGSSSTYGANGSNSQFASLTASVGGGGGGGGANPSTLTPGNGGSGGGGVGYSGDRSGGTGTSGQGYNGGIGKDASPNYGAGGGGGATAAGGDGTSTVGGAGGAGSSAYSSWGLATGTGQNVSGTYYYAGGGGGATYLGGTPGIASNGGGGAGGSTYAGSNAVINTGGGGGGGGYDGTGYAGGNGSSGLVIVRYAK